MLTDRALGLVVRRLLEVVQSAAGADAPSLLPGIVAHTALLGHLPVHSIRAQLRGDIVDLLHPLQATVFGLCIHLAHTTLGVRDVEEILLLGVCPGRAHACRCASQYNFTFHNHSISLQVVYELGVSQNAISLAPNGGILGTLVEKARASFTVPRLIGYLPVVSRFTNCALTAKHPPHTAYQTTHCCKKISRSSLLVDQCSLSTNSPVGVKSFELGDLHYKNHI